ncbi:MAG: YggT family protein [Clostridiales Family XIII bacterium]|jgi:YggT family protein|nr:YggT family protein [Clostridiales Family XIII bacterium]
MLTLLTVIYYLLYIYILVFVMRAFLSWPMAMAGGRVPKFVVIAYNICSALTEPLVRPIRRFTSRVNTGNFDFSILGAMIVLIILQRIVQMLFRMIAY